MRGKALFWDFDGTLIHPNESFFTALSTALQKYGYEIASEKIRTLLHSACSWYKPEVSYEKMTGAKWWEEQARTPETDFLCQELKDILSVLEEHSCS